MKRTQMSLAKVWNLRQASKIEAIALAVTLLCCLVLVSVALAQASANYRLPWSALASGGPMQSAQYAMNSTLGQSSPIGHSASSSYRIGAGYWYGAFRPPAPLRRLLLPLLLKH